MLSLCSHSHRSTRRSFAGRSVAIPLLCCTLFGSAVGCAPFSLERGVDDLRVEIDAPSGFEAPVLLTAEGAPIDTDVGHAAPYLCDWDRDGDRDLLVGQFGEGKMRIYENVGTERRPRYVGPTWFEAGGDIARVPAG